MKMKKIYITLCTLAITLFLWACEKPNETLVLYTSQPDKDIASFLETFHKIYPDIKIDVFRSGTSEILNKLDPEIKSDDIEADIVMISDAIVMENLHQKGALIPLTIDLSNLPSAFYNQDKTYCGTKKISIGLAYHKDIASPPLSFADLNKPEFKDKIVMPSPLYSGAAALMLGVILDNPSLGWDFYKKLQENGVKVVDGNGDVIKTIASGEKTIGIVVDFMAFTAKDRGIPLEFVYPKEGIITLTEPIALLKKKKISQERLEKAVAFVQFVLSPEGQNFAKKQGYKSIREADHADSKMMPLNPKKLLADMEMNKKKFAELFKR